MWSIRKLHAWDRVHRWSSLACTIFLLVLCLTGLPLIFRQEIDRALQASIRAPPHPGHAHAALDQVVAAAAARFPGTRPLFASHEPRDDRIWYVTVQGSSSSLEQAAVDSATGEVLGEPRMAENGIMGVIRSLHVDLFAGQRGALFLGTMGMAFIVSLVSGTVLYAPFLARRPFGAVRLERRARLRWIDRHNLLGIATLAWALVVGATGCINTTADLLIAHWRSLALAELPASPAAVTGSTAPLQDSLDRAKPLMHGEEIAFVAFPGTAFTDAHRLGVYVRGSSMLRSRTLEVIFADSRTAYRPHGMPWYLHALFLSQPLHFGNYGGWPLKIVWAFYDIVTIVVLASGVFIWFTKRPSPRAPNESGESMAARA
jgi:uncharacterized iron-regulated membrane protein